MSNLSDVGAERAVLAGIFQFGKDSYIDVSDIVDVNTFTVESNQLIFKCLENAVRTNPKLDVAVFLSAAHDLGLDTFFKDKTEMEYIRSLLNFPIEQPNVLGQAKKIRKLEISRIYQNKLKKAYAQLEKVTGNETLDQITSIAEKPIFDFSKEFKQGQDDRPKLIGENIKEYVQYLKDNPNRKVGIPSGWDKFDEVIGGGFRRKTIALIGARSGCGKSVLADNVAVHVSHRLKIPVLMLDTEMDTNDHHDRLLAYFARININKIAQGKFVGNKWEEEKVDKAAKFISEMTYTYKSIAGRPFDEILAIIRRWIYQVVGFDENGRTNDCLVIYDYFKLMDSDGLKNMQEYQAIGFQISDMHNFCVEYDVPVLAFVQLNRDGIDKELQSSISQSDRLVWLSTNVSIFKDKTEEEILEDGELNGNKKLIPVKARHGAGMSPGNYINMYMQGEFASIIELRTKADVKLSGGNSTGFDIDEHADSEQDKGNDDRETE